jgi:hypothetical protein
MIRVRRQGLGVCVAAAGWGVAIAAFGFATALPLALLMLAVAGAADFISAVLRSTILLQVTPDSMRGRLPGSSSPRSPGRPALGNLEAGALAALVSLRVAIVSGGFLCVLGTASSPSPCPRSAATRSRRDRRELLRAVGARRRAGARRRNVPLSTAWAA